MVSSWNQIVEGVFCVHNWNKTIKVLIFRFATVTSFCDGMKKLNQTIKVQKFGGEMAIWKFPSLTLHKFNFVKFEWNAAILQLLICESFVAKMSMLKSHRPMTFIVWHHIYVSSSVYVCWGLLTISKNCNRNRHKRKRDVQAQP